MDARASQTACPEDLWTLAELCLRVEAALSVAGPGQPNGQVREIPDARTVRYYTTLGLIDRPAQLRGRTALYGPRHLLQLVAIKRLQARGLRLADVQRELVGLPDAALARTAAIPPAAALPPAPEVGPRSGAIAADAPPPEPAASAAEPHIPTPRRERAFWAVEPRPRDPGVGEGEGEVAEAEGTPREPAGEGRRDAGEPELQVLRLAAGVHLVLSGDRPVGAAGLERVRREAAPLLAAIRELRATAVPPGREDGKDGS
jgi:hypothetical protein